MLKKPKRKSNQKVSYWSKKADKKLQEIGRLMYADKGCLICGGTYSCLHHFYPKSQSTALRYKWNNLINICNGCHFSHHNGNPDIHAKIIEIKGQDWFNDLQAERNANRYIKAGYAYYRDIYYKLEKLTPYKI